MKLANKNEDSLNSEIKYTNFRHSNDEINEPYSTYSKPQ